MPRQRYLVNHPPVHPQRPDAVGDLGPRLDLRPLGDDRHPAAVLDSPVGGELRIDLGKHLGLQLHQPRDRAAHPARRVMLGEPEGRRHQRVARVAGRVVWVLGSVPADRGRVAIHLRVEEVGHRRLERLVEGGQRPVEQTAGRVQPAAAVAHHDERVRPADRIHTASVRRGAIVRLLVGGEVWDVVSRPATLPLVPPHVALALRPWPALRIGAGAVVQDPPVRGPRPRPLRRDDPALCADVTGTAPARLIDPILVNTGVDPAAAGGRAVAAQLVERADGPARRDVVAVDLLDHGLHVGLAHLAALRVIPLQVHDRPIPLALGPGVARFDPFGQMVHEPQLRARVTRRMQRLVAELHQALGVGERPLLLDVRGGGHQEHLGLDRLGTELARLHLRRVAPEGGRLDLGQIAHDQPLQPRQRAPLKPRRAESRPPGSDPSRRGPPAHRRGRGASSRSGSGCRSASAASRSRNRSPRSPPRRTTP